MTVEIKDTAATFPGAHLLSRLGLRRGILMDLLIRAAGEEWSDRGQSPIPYYCKLLSRAEDQILIVSADLHPPLVEDPDIQRLVSTNLARGVWFEIIFSKPGASYIGQVEEIVRLENPGTFQLKHQYREQLRLFWVNGHPRVEFAVVDSQHALLEEPDHAAGTLPATITRYRDPAWAGLLESRFCEVRNQEGWEILSGIDEK